MATFEDILRDINGYGRYQKIRFLLICISGLLPPIMTYMDSFISANPYHICAYDGTITSLNNTTNDLDTQSSNNVTSISNKSVSIEQCSYKENGQVYQCKSWNFDRTYYYTTLTEDWNMVCERYFLRAHVQTVFFSGTLIGSFVLGILSDKFGRRPIMLASFLLIIFGAFASTFGPQNVFGTTISYSIYIISRFLIAIGTRGINITGFVLGLELLNESKRTFGGICFQYAFSVGQLILVALAYFIRDWRTLSISISLPTTLFLLYFFVLPESPRWLITKNRNDEALKIFQIVAKTNKRKFNENLWKEFLATQEKKTSKDENLITVFHSFVFAILTLIIFLHWMVNSFIFYGVGLKSNNLGLNPYITFALSAIVELLGDIMTHLVIDRFGRKIPYAFFLILSGISCLSISFIENTVAIVCLAMLGKFFISASYAIVYIYSSEIFPTTVRNSCMGTCSTMGKLGSMIAPMIIVIGDKLWKQLPFLVFGTTAVVCGLSTFILPETLGRPTYRTIKEAEGESSMRCLKKLQAKNDSRNNFKQNGIVASAEMRELL